MNLLQWLTGHRRAHHDPDTEWSVGGNVYYGRGGSVNGEETPIAGEYLALAQRGYKGNGPVFALMSLRQLVFSEARFQYQRMREGRPGKLVGDRSLALLERPWTNGTTGDLLSRMIQDADLAGNSFTVRRDRMTSPTLREGGEMLKRLRPDWVTIIMGSDEDPDLFGDAIDGEVIAYAYHPHGRTIGEADIILPGDMAHFAPYPDPEFQARGTSWLTPVLREIDGDQAATTHKNAFFKNGAMSTTVISLDPALDVDKVKRFRAMFEEQHKGVANAYRTMILGGGADARTLGADLRQLDFKATQGAGETRLAAAAGVPASIVGFSEGMAGSALNAGNYSSARRRFADGTMRPLWRMAAAALENLLDPDPDVRLWYDDRDIPFLREDRQVVAEIQATQAQTINYLIQAGYKADPIVDALVNEDWGILKGQHTGLPSIQVQEPAVAPPAQTQQATAPTSNGQANGKTPAQQGAAA